MVVDLVAAELEALQERISGRFVRSEPRTRVREYVAGLERKNGWTLAERAGEVSPGGDVTFAAAVGLGRRRGP
nr:putative transposase [Rhodococcus sp. JVH1]